MVGMRMENFGGMIPLLSKRLLPENMASFAANCYLRGGEIRGLREPKLLKQYPVGGINPTYAKSIRIPDPDFPLVPVWKPFVSRNAKIFPNPLRNDLYRRFIWLDGNSPGNPQPLMQNSLARIKNGDPPYPLGVPGPATAISVVVVGGGTGVTTLVVGVTGTGRVGAVNIPTPDPAFPLGVSGVGAVGTALLLDELDGIAFPAGIEGAGAVGVLDAAASGVVLPLNPIITRSYVYTYVNLFNEESAPSPPVVVSGYTNGTWELSGIVNPAFAAERGITKVYIYRTISGALGTSFFRVTEQVVTDPTYSDTRLDSVVAAESILLQSFFWDVPPLMEGIVVMPNGFFAGWNKRDIFFSEPYRPWAWPVGYTLAAAYDVIDAGVIEQTMVALTATSPVLVTGVNPAAMSIAATFYVAPCISPSSITQATEGIYFASTGGLMLISSGGIVPVTHQVIGRDEWQNTYIPRIEMATAHDGQYISMNETGQGFVFDPRGIQSGIIDIVNYPPVSSLWTDPYTGEAHMMIANGVYQWSSSMQPLIAAEWLSKDFQFPKPINFGAIQVNIDPNYDTGSVLTPVIDESRLPVGGPWPDKTSIINYNRINGATINTNPAEGSFPPGEANTVDPWPYWYGVVPGPAAFDLPDGAVCQLIVFANDRIVFRELVSSGTIYRLPSGFKTDRWQIQIKSRVPVMNVQIAETSKELARV